MRWLLALAVCGTLLSGQSFAGEPGYDPYKNDLGYRGEFRRSGAGLVCVVGTLGPKVAPEDVSKFSDQPCLYIGPPDVAVVIGADAQPYLDRLGTPDSTSNDSAGSLSHVYPLGPGDNPPFLVLTVQEKKVAAFQITGTEGLDQFVFNQVTIGAPSAKVRERFGDPMQIRDMGDGTRMWSYVPWPISFLIADSKVVSMRIANYDLR